MSQEKPKDPYYLTDEEYKQIYSKVPRVCVDLVVVLNKGIILTKRSIPPHEGAWHLPGGRIKMRESVENAIARIAAKEIGLTHNNKDEKVLGYMEFLKDGDGGFAHSVSIVFLLNADIQKDKVNLDNQSTEWEIFRELPEKMLPEHKEFLKGVLKDILDNSTK